MMITEMIEEWRKGCSCADVGKPEQCDECTTGLIRCIEIRAKWMEVAAQRMNEALRKQLKRGGRE